METKELLTKTTKEERQQIKKVLDRARANAILNDALNSCSPSFFKSSKPMGERSYYNYSYAESRKNEVEE